MAASVIGALRVNLGLDSAEFQDGLKKANAGLDKFALGVGAAAAAVGAAFAAGIGAAVHRVENMNSAIARLDQALSNAGNAARTSGKEVADWADELQRRTGRAAEEVLAVGANLASFNFGEEVFFRAIELGDDMAAAWGGDLRSNLEGLSRALDDPENGFAMLRKRGIALTDTQESLVKSLMASNDKLGAQKVVLEALEAQVKGVAEAGFQGLTKSIANMWMAIDGFFDTIVQSTGFGTMLAAAIDVVTRAIDFLTSSLGTVAEYAAVAGTTMALLYAPVALSGIASLVVAIGTSLPAAFAAARVAMLGFIAANPFLAIGAAVTIAVTAIYHFRDEIQKAIGVDVVAVVKDAGNAIIGTFMGAYAAVKDAWGNLPNFFSGIGKQAWNALLDGMSGSAITWTNPFTGAKHDLLSVDFSGAKASLSDAEQSAVSQAATTFDRSYMRDYIGEIGSSFSASTPAVANFGSALAGVNEELDDMGGGGGGGGKGGSGKAAKAKTAVDRITDSIENAKESLGQGFGSILDGLVNKTVSWGEALTQAGREILKYMNQINVAQGGKGLFGGGLISGLFGSLLGFSTGGTIMPGGAGGVDSQLVMFRKSPNERVDITKPGQTLTAGGRGGDTYHIDARGADQAAITRLQRGLAERDKSFGQNVDNRNNVRNSRGTRG